MIKVLLKHRGTWKERVGFMEKVACELSHG